MREPMLSIEETVRNIDEARDALDVIRRRKQYIKDNPPVPPEFDTKKELTWDVLKNMIGLPVFDSRLGQWLLVDAYDEKENVIWLRGIGKIYFPIDPSYEIINPIYCLK